MLPATFSIHAVVTRNCHTHWQQLSADCRGHHAPPPPDIEKPLSQIASESYPVVFT
jgi:hypothetical protein